MNADDLQPGLLIQLNGSGGSDLYKVCGTYPDGTITLEWVYAWPRGVDADYLPSRSTVKRVSADQVFDFVEPTDRLVQLYTDALDREAS